MIPPEQKYKVFIHCGKYFKNEEEKIIKNIWKKKIYKI